MKILLAAASACLLCLPAASQAETRLVANGDHRIAFHVIPGKRPVVVLDAGGGLDSTYWTSLAPQIAARTGSMVISYDRSGFGASDEVRGPWNLQHATTDLAVGLRRLGATQDVILVAHSIAGEIATDLAIRHPTWLSGAVLVDANVPNYFTEPVIASTTTEYAPLVAAARAAPSTPEARQLLAVADSFATTSREFHAMHWPASVPAIVIVSAQTPASTPAEAQWWRDAHADFVKEAGNRRLVTAERSSHDVVKDRPDVILQAVADLVAQRRNGAR